MTIGPGTGPDTDILHTFLSSSWLMRTKPRYRLNYWIISSIFVILKRSWCCFGKPYPNWVFCWVTFLKLVNSRLFTTRPFSWNLFVFLGSNESNLVDWFRCTFIPKKVELLIRFFEPFWISRVFYFFLRTFGKVEGHPGPLEPSDETYTQSKFDISGSNETMQNALASIV